MKIIQKSITKNQAKRQLFQSLTFPVYKIQMRLQMDREIYLINLTDFIQKSRIKGKRFYSIGRNNS